MIVPALVGAREHNEREPGQKTGEHRCEQRGSARGSLAKLLPDEYTPDCRDHGGTLAEPVGDCEAGAPRRDEVEGYAGSPDEAAQNTGHVRRQAPREVVAEI